MLPGVELHHFNSAWLLVAGCLATPASCLHPPLCLPTALSLSFSLFPLPLSPFHAIQHSTGETSNLWNQRSPYPSSLERTCFFFFSSFFNIYIHYVQKGSMFRIPSTRSFFSVPFCSPKDGSSRQFFHRSAGNGIRSERKSKKVIRRRKKRDLWGEQRGISRAKRSFPRLDAVREKTFFRLATLFRLPSITVYNQYFHIISFPILIRCRSVNNKVFIGNIYKIYIYTYIWSLK